MDTKEHKEEKIRFFDWLTRRFESLRSTCRATSYVKSGDDVLTREVKYNCEALVVIR